MIELLRGNKENLEGKVTIYSKFNTGNIQLPFSKEIFALYMSNDIEDLIKKTNPPRQVIKEIKIKRDMLDMIKNIIIKEKGIDKNILSQELLLIGYPMDVYSEQDLTYQNSGDLVYTGSFSSPELCKHSIKLGQEIYSLNYQEQILRNLGKSFKKQTPSSNSKDYKVYSDIEKKDMEEYIHNKFISPMIRAKINKDSEEKENIKTDFIKFASGAPFTEDIFGIFDAVERADNSNDNMLNLYIKKIIAVNNDNMTRAEKINNLIRRLQE